MKNKICHCENVEFGNYDNQITMRLKFEDKLVCIDTCIATEIGYLWHKGIKTLNSCCGHRKLPATVIVDEASIEQMKKLGYKNANIKCASPELTFQLGIL